MSIIVLSVRGLLRGRRTTSVVAADEPEAEPAVYGPPVLVIVAEAQARTDCTLDKG